MKYILIIMGPVLTLLGAIFAFREKRTNDKLNPNKKSFAIHNFTISIVGVLLTVFTNVNSLQEKNTSDKEKKISDSVAKLRTDQLQQKSDYIIEIQEKNGKQTQGLSDSLIATKQSLSNSQQTTIDNLIGSNGPYYVVLGNNNGKLSAVIVNDNDKQIVNGQIEITDYDEILKCKRSEQERIIIDLSCFKKNTQDYGGTSVPAHSRIFLTDIEKSVDEGKLEIALYNQYNQEFLEDIYYVKDGRHLDYYGKLYYGKNNKLIYIKTIKTAGCRLQTDFSILFPLPLKERGLIPITWR